MARPITKAFKPKRLNFEKAKFKKDAPCLFFQFDEKKGETRPYHPAVNCDMNCASCGFNPTEQERRLATGVFKPAAVIDTIMDENGKATQKPALVKRLTFRKEEKWGWINALN